MKFDFNHLEKTYIIAEMSGNHAGSLERAKEIIHKAKEAGADCIKIQTYTPDTLTINCNNEYFNIKDGTWDGENLYSLYGKAYTPWEWQPELKKEADMVGIDFLSTPFDTTAVDFLEEMGLSFYKIASFEIVDLPLIRYVASKKKPMIISTGMASAEEIREALEAAYSVGNHDIVLLKCSSAYPANPSEMNLLTIPDMKEKFKVPVGLSDHSMGGFSATLAVALGAKVIEKHFCLGREIENPDASFSMTPEEFSEMVKAVRKAEEALGTPTYKVTKQEENSIVFRRSIFAAKDIKAGEKLSDDNVRIIRPGYGIKPKYIDDILGMTVKEDIPYGHPIAFEQIEKGAVLFLTNNENTYDLYEWLKEKDGKVYKFENKIDLDIIKALSPSFIISFNYKHIIKKDVIDYMGNKIVNLHTSYLPFNRGAAPNFFSFYDNTKKGVTIHLMDEGLDTGDILCQKELIFDESKETFSSTYDTLQKSIKELFKDNWEAIKDGKIAAYKQEGDVTSHKASELAAIKSKADFSWDMNIKAVLNKINGAK